MNGHIDTDNLREGRAKTDTYQVRRNALVKNAIEIEKLTGCLVKLRVQPTWKHKDKEEFEDTDFNRSNVTASTSYTNDSMHVTSVEKARKRPGETSARSKGILYDPNICQRCHIRHESEADIETDFPWINCGSKSCK